MQLFSNEELTLRMTEKLHLLHIIVYSIKSMMSSVLTLNTLGDIQRNYHEVVDCGEHVMKESSLMDINFFNYSEILELTRKQEKSSDIHNLELRIRICVGLA